MKIEGCRPELPQSNLHMRFLKAQVKSKPNSYPTPNVADTVRGLREVTLRSHEYDQRHVIKPDWEGATPHDPKGSLSSSLDWSFAFFTQPTAS